MGKEPFRNVPFVITIILLLTANPALARVATGGQAGAFLSWGAGARSLGMGKAFVSVADDASATYWNPAGLSKIEQQEAVGLHTQLFAGTMYDFLSYVYPTVELGTFGASFTSLYLGGFEVVNEDNIKTGEFSDARAALGLSYGREMLEGLDLGVNLKYLYHKIYTYTKGNVILDLGLLWTPPWWRLKHLRLGINIQNLVSVTLGETQDKLPRVIRAGLSYRLLQDRLVIGVDTDKALAKATTTYFNWHAGVEYLVMKYAALRLGVDAQETSVGFGVKFRDYEIDYAFALQELGYSNRVSLTARFGRPMEVQREELADKYYREGIKAYHNGLYILAQEKLAHALDLHPERMEIRDLLVRLDTVIKALHLEEKKQKKSEQYYKQALKYYKQHNWLRAREVIEKAIELNPLSQPARELKEKINNIIKVTIK